MASKKIKKKQREADLADDAFERSGRTWVDWAEVHWWKVVILLVLILGGVFGMELMRGQTTRSASLVTNDLREAVDSYQEATDLRQIITATSADALNRGFEEARTKLKRVYEEHPTHEVGRLAKLYDADLARRLGKNNDAEKLFREYVDSAKPADIMLSFALEGLGYALEAQSKDDEALHYYQRMADGPRYYQSYGLKHKARLLEKKGDVAGAIEAYKAIVDISSDKEESPEQAVIKLAQGGGGSGLKAYAEARIKALE